MSFLFQIAGSGYAANYAQIAAKLPQVFQITHLVSRGSGRSQSLANKLNINFSEQFQPKIPAVIAVNMESQIDLLNSITLDVLIEPELSNEAAELVLLRENILVANHWGSLPAVVEFIRQYKSILHKYEVRLVDVECSERAIYPLGYILSRLWPEYSKKIRLRCIYNSNQNATQLTSLRTSFYEGYLEEMPLSLKIYRRTNDKDNGSDSPQIVNIRITTDGGIIHLTSPFGPVISNEYQGCLNPSEHHISISHGSLTINELSAIRLRTNYMILDAFKDACSEGKNSSCYIFDKLSLRTGHKVSQLVSYYNV